MITSQEFFDLTGYSKSQINEKYLDSVIERFINVLTDEVGDIFTLVPSTTEEIRGNNATLVKVGAWQSSSLVVRLGSYGIQYPNIKTLSENTDFIFQKKKGVVYGVELINSVPSDMDFIRMTGTKGYSATLPDDLYYIMYYAVKIAVEYNQNSVATLGNGMIKMEKSLNQQVSFQDQQDLQRNAEKIVSGNLMGVPTINRVIYKYKSIFKKTTIIR
jgi:hypothetical protein